ncbi:MAG: YitT family protein [Phaeodactylibacter sp.]|nr:YitT family protein [Phaeodactylibacter sp.]MCB9274018.1 YitT family protein [Lewinellaceae bacterium]
MNPFFQQIIIDTVRKRLKGQGKAADSALVAREASILSVELSHLLKESLLIALGIISAGFGLKGFLLPNGFIDGGVTGISLLVEVSSGIPLSILLVAINLPFLILGANTVSRPFAIKSILAIVGLALAVHMIHYPVVTNDKLLIAVFGGFFLGLGIGLSIRGGAVIDGTEVLAVFLSRKSSLSIGDIILIFNILIFSFGAYVLGIEVALYAILTYLAASKTVDYVIDGIEEYIGVTIVSSFSEDIRLAVIEKLGRGCTVYSGKRGFAARGERLKNTEIIYTVITRLELSRLKTEVDKADPDAFIIMQSIKDTKGGMIKKRPLKEH